MAFGPAKDRFLEELTKGSTVKDAAAAACVTRQATYLWKKDEAFAAAWEAAIEEGVDDLEKEARRRAYEGVEEPVFQGGKEVGRVRKYSDALIMFLLKGRRRAVFGDKQEVTGAGGGPIPTEDATKHSHRDLAKAVLAVFRQAKGEPAATPTPETGEAA